MSHKICIIKPVTFSWLFSLLHVAKNLDIRQQFLSISKTCDITTGQHSMRCKTKVKLSDKKMGWREFYAHNALTNISLFSTLKAFCSKWSHLRFYVSFKNCVKPHNCMQRNNHYSPYNMLRKFAACQFQFLYFCSLQKLVENKICSQFAAINLSLNKLSICNSNYRLKWEKLLQTQLLH